MKRTREALAQFRKRIPRSFASDSADVAGMGCFVAAAFWWNSIIGLLVLGVALLVIGWVTD
jgi:hypothetical protein